MREVFRVADPLEMVAVPNEVVPFKKLTVPVAADGTAAVRVKFTPGPTVRDDEVRVVVLFAFVTLSATPELMLAEKPFGLEVAL